MLRGNFPGGSIIGASRVRSMKVIDEQEFTERGPYCGIIGFFGNVRDLNTCIGICIVYFDEKHFYPMQEAASWRSRSPGMNMKNCF